MWHEHREQEVVATRIRCLMTASRYSTLASEGPRWPWRPSRRPGLGDLHGGLVPAGVSGGLVEGGQEAFDAGIQHAVRLRGIHGSAHAALSPAHVRGQRIRARGQAGCALFALKCIARFCTIFRTISSGTSHSLALRSTAAPGNRQLLRIVPHCCPATT